MRRLCSISIDLDSIDCYYRIHGLGQSPAQLRDLILTRCAPRFAHVLEQRGIAATFFVVGCDLDSGAEARERVAELARAGHELGNHSYSHRYELARTKPDVAFDEIARGHDRVSEVAGCRTVGFRAPGYDLSPAMVDALCALGYEYDSSIFPAPVYYAAKLAVMAALRAAGRPSGAVVTNPLALIAPTDPYRPAAEQPWRRGSAPLVELPIAVTPVGRLPAIGTSLLLAPGPVRRLLLSGMRGREFFNLEMHGIDLCDAVQDEIPAQLIARQPDLRAPLATKLRAFEAVLDRLAADYDFLTLREAAARLRP